MLLFLLICLLHQTNGQWRRYEPYWIQTKDQAEAIGVDLQRFLTTHCAAASVNPIFNGVLQLPVFRLLVGEFTICIWMTLIQNSGWNALNT